MAYLMLKATILMRKHWSRPTAHYPTCDICPSFIKNGEPKQKGGENMKKLLERLLVEDNGQGLVEYTLIVVLVALVFWVAIKSTNVGSGLAAGWSKITDCVTTPSACDSAS